MKKLVLLGIGHTNAYVVHKWCTQPIPDCKLICISNHATATYSGMLPGTLGKQFDPDAMRIDLPALCHRAGAELILDETTGLDLPHHRLRLASHDSVEFDALSIGVGSMPMGWEAHRHDASIVPIKPMQTFLGRLTAQLEHSTVSAQRPVELAIVGGGVAGVELALCLLQRFERETTSQRFSLTIYTSQTTIAGGMKSRSQRRLQQILAQRGIRVKAQYRVVAAADRQLMSADGRLDHADVVVWATGAAPPPLLKSLGLQRDQDGFVATSATLQSLSDPRIFAVGDCGTVIENPSPKAGVYAVGQSPILWHNLQALFTGGRLRRYDPQPDFLKILNTGDGRAMLEYGPFTLHARGCLWLKNWIDRRFISEFQ